MIPFNQYVAITSGVGGGSGVRLRDLIARLFTNNDLLPPGTYLEFADADSVLSYFGATSPEYLRAAFYFGFISKNITKPNKISFGRWVDTASAPKVYGNKTAKLLATYTAVAAGSLNLTMGANTNSVTPINLSGAASLAAVAALLQTAIRAAAGPQFVAATVVYDAVTNRFNLTGGVAGAGVMAVNASGVGTDLAPLLGWTAASGAIIAQGSAVETVTATLSASVTLSNNFASFAFIPTLTAPQMLEAATYNKTQNNMFMFCARVADLAAATQANTDLKNLGGVGVTLAPLATEYPELLPAMVLAATDYSKRNASQNYMFQQVALTPSVTDGPTALGYDALKVNYYGQTQSAGVALSFYQRGTLMGVATDPSDMNVYANEIWFKDAVGASLMSLLLSVGRVPANLTGRAMLMTSIAANIAAAVRNGTISVGKGLNATQKLYVAQLTGEDTAWVQVQNLGYWLDCVMQSYVNAGNGVTEWKAVYTLIYSKDDTVRKVEGSHVLI